ncbi:GNAT family N-acetyltransferase [Micromonospora sp. NPDC049559]|uniref:GNAT family N-acetyltransferase n=1 Tax=Micromonospora sp. NPDC049559 TaxID=3155923 RepID=UPI00343602D9
MTDLRRAGAGTHPGTDAAFAAAEAAALAAGVRLRELTELDDLEPVYRLYDGIWHPDPTNPPVTTALLGALAKAGNYVGGAYDGGELVGACVGFFSPPADEAMHSHIAGVGAAALGRGVGYALKLHQRAWALARGVRTIGWTFDPLVRRNAYFNLAKLAATPAEYLPNFYRGMRDGINGDDETDRLLVHWDLAGDGTVAACAGIPRRVDAEAERAAGAVVGLGRGDGDAPVAGDVTGGTVLVAVPTDVEALRRADPGCARAWRVGLREVLGGLLGAGARVTGFDRAGWYLVARDGAGAQRR